MIVTTQLLEGELEELVRTDGLGAACFEERLFAVET